MAHAPFKVTPLARYDGARYPSSAAPELPPEEESRGHSLMLQILACVFSGALMIGVVACGTDQQDLICTLPACLDSSGNNDDDGTNDKNSCTPGTVECTNQSIIATCLEGGAMTYQSCETVCDETYGTIDAYSLGCNDDAADPCQCRYDMIDGGMPFCGPDEMYCSGDDLMVCDPDWGDFLVIDCDAECESLLGFGAYSEGCDANADDPCLCNYDIMLGVMAQCTPGEVVCPDTETVAVCGDNYDYTYTNCNERCQETLGPGAYSLGCDSAAVDPCQCEYDMIAGDMPACMPGDIYCIDAATVEVCDDTYWPVTYDCAGYCELTVGPGSTSSGCDSTDPEDPCGCS